MLAWEYVAMPWYLAQNQTTQNSSMDERQVHEVPTLDEKLSNDSIKKISLWHAKLFGFSFIKDVVKLTAKVGHHKFTSHYVMLNF